MENQTLNINEPLDLIKQCLNHVILIKCRQNRELTGKLFAFDAHLNMIIGDAEEIYSPENQEKQTRQMQTIFLRGDQIIHICPITLKLGL